MSEEINEMVDKVVEEWADAADFETLVDYAKTKYAEWLLSQSKERIREIYSEIDGDEEPGQ